MIDTDIIYVALHVGPTYRQGFTMEPPDQYDWTIRIGGDDAALYQINTKNCSLSIVLTATHQKNAKIIKKVLLLSKAYHVDIQAMWWWVISHF